MPKLKAGSGTPFPKEGLLVFYEQLHHNRRDYVARMEGTVRYFTTIVTSLITLTIGGGFVLLQSQDKISPSASFWAKLLLALILVIAAGMSSAAVQNLKRECENEYVQMAVILATEKILGLQKTVPTSLRFFSEESRIVPNYLSLPLGSFPEKDPTRIMVETIDKFVQVMISKERSFYKYFRRVFCSFIGLSAGLALVLVLWAVVSRATPAPTPEVIASPTPTLAVRVANPGATVIPTPASLSLPAIDWERG